MSDYRILIAIDLLRVIEDPAPFRTWVYVIERVVPPTLPESLQTVLLWSIALLPVLRVLYPVAYE